ncbi:MAG: TetR/AcrR family transcriptional regulator [Chloroflexi bacterium]|nr:TetR/AcrR family transcriptional regulator [Chloroflexota bacterium]
MTAATSAISRKRQVACNAILDAASQIIAEKGIDTFTISEIAKRAQINRALIYHYFQNRDNLVAEAINYMIERNQKFYDEIGTDAMESSARMFIAHPEIARFIFQLLLTGRPLLGLNDRVTDTAAALEQLLKKRHAEPPYNPAFPVIALILTQLSWAFSREEFARLLNISVEEADDHFIGYLRWATELTINAMTAAPDVKLAQPAS